jgi:hypothetical protein
MIGAVAGAVIGGLTGGVPGAIAGFQLGGKIGLAAQTVIQACVPKNKLQIKCTS